MIKRTPQEIADFFGCYVFQGRSKDSFYMTQGKPAWNGADFCLHCDGILSLIDEGLVDIPENHDWTYLYEPRPCSTETADSDNKQDAYSGKPADSDNKEAPHQSQVHVHQEYDVIYAEYPERLSIKVTQLIHEGWKPVGGIVCLPPAHREDSETFYQAMVRGLE